MKFVDIVLKGNKGKILATESEAVKVLDKMKLEDSQPNDIISVRGVFCFIKSDFSGIVLNKEMTEEYKESMQYDVMPEESDIKKIMQMLDCTIEQAKKSLE